MWNLKYDGSELIYKGETDSHREQARGLRGRREWERIAWKHTHYLM